MVAAASTCGLVVGFVLAAAITADADPVVLRPASFVEIVDPAPIDGLNLRGEIAQNVALGPGAETRVFYEFELQGLRSAHPPVVLHVHRTRPGFSSCADLSPCPDLTHFDIFGYAGNGAADLSDYNRGLFLARFDTLPGHSFNLDVTGFVVGLRGANVDFAGFAVHPASRGAMELSDARLAATPEPGSLSLLTVGGLALKVRRRIAVVKRR